MVAHPDAFLKTPTVLSFGSALYAILAKCCHTCCALFQLHLRWVSNTARSG